MHLTDNPRFDPLTVYFNKRRPWNTEDWGGYWFQGIIAQKQHLWSNVFGQFTVLLVFSDWRSKFGNSVIKQLCLKFKSFLKVYLLADLKFENSIKSRWLFRLFLKLFSLNECLKRILNSFELFRYSSLWNCQKYDNSVDFSSIDCFSSIRFISFIVSNGKILSTSWIRRRRNVSSFQ